MRKATLRKGKFSLEQNDTGRDSRIATYEIGDYDALMVNKASILSFDLVTKYEESGVDLDTANVDIDLDEKLPDKPLRPLDGGIAVAYYSTDGGTSWTRTDIDSANFYTADSNPNRITLAADEGETGTDIKIYHLFLGGEVTLVDIPAPVYGAGELFLDDYPVTSLNSMHPNYGPYYEGPDKKLPKNHKLVVKLNSDVQVSWDDDALNAKFKLPVFHYDSSELTKSPQQLHNEIIDELQFRK